MAVKKSGLLFNFYLFIQPQPYLSYPFPRPYNPSDIALPRSPRATYVGTYLNYFILLPLPSMMHNKILEIPREWGIFHFWYN